ncbi:MAG: CRISPR-associated protein Cas4 [Nitrososphaerales archaeon]
MVLQLDQPDFTGTQVNYYFVCKRKLWFFSHGMEQEEEYDLVLLGKLLHEHYYQRELKEIQIGRIKIDFFGKKGEVHEIKRSRKIENAHTHQLLYYLYYIKKVVGIDVKGILHYPLLKRKVELNLGGEEVKRIEDILKKIDEVVSLSIPPQPLWIKACKLCAYRELCWS